MNIDLEKNSVQANPPVTIICGKKSVTVVGTVDYSYNDGETRCYHGSFNLLSTQIRELEALERKSESELSSVCDLF